MQCLSSTARSGSSGTSEGMWQKPALLPTEHPQLHQPRDQGVCWRRSAAPRRCTWAARLAARAWGAGGLSPVVLRLNKRRHEASSGLKHTTACMRCQGEKPHARQSRHHAGGSGAPSIRHPRQHSMMVPVHCGSGMPLRRSATEPWSRPLPQQSASPSQVPSLRALAVLEGKLHSHGPPRGMPAARGSATFSARDGACQAPEGRRRFEAIIT